MTIPDIRATQAWRKLSKQVVTEEPLCWLRLPGCTHMSTQADHIIPISVRPDLALVRANCRGCCRRCNERRGTKTMTQLKEMPRESPQPRSWVPAAW